MLQFEPAINRPDLLLPSIVNLLKLVRNSISLKNTIIWFRGGLARQTPKLSSKGGQARL
jgi:hypothetical protein